MTKIFLILIFSLSTLYASKDKLIINIMENAEINHNIKKLKYKLLKNEHNNIHAENFASIYNTEKIKEETQRKLQKQMTLKELEFLNDWYKNEIALKIKKANQITITKEIAEKLVSANLEFYKKERVLLIGKINQALRYSAIDFYFISIVADYQIKKYPNYKQGQEIELYKEDKTLLKRRLRNQTVAFLYYKYQDISTKELKKYRNFLYTNQTYKFLDITQNTLNQHITNILKLYMKN